MVPGVLLQSSVLALGIPLQKEHIDPERQAPRAWEFTGLFKALDTFVFSEETCATFFTLRFYKCVFNHTTLSAKIDFNDALGQAGLTISLQFAW